jgi:hypothetical protein
MEKFEKKIGNSLSVKCPYTYYIIHMCVRVQRSKCVFNHVKIIRRVNTCI